MKKLLILLLCLPTFIYSQTDISGIISANQTWTIAWSPYTVTGNVLVNSGVTLTIEAGVTVKLDDNKAIVINGALIANGSTSNRIIFTSNQTNPQTGDWANIKFNSSATSSSWNSNNIYLLAV